MTRSFKIITVISILSIVTLGVASTLKSNQDQTLLQKMTLGHIPLIGHKTLNKEDVSQILGKRPLPGGFLESSEVVKIQDKDLLVQYSVDAELQKAISSMLKAGQVHYGAFVAIDPRTGQVLAMVSQGTPENLTLRATFPSASVFKIITAAAVLEGKQLQYNSMIPVRGSYHTLYRQNVLHAGGIEPQSAVRHTRLISLSEAFGKSVNSVFGKLGIFGAGPDTLRKVANQFQFNSAIPFEMPVDSSTATIPNDAFGLAESASGFTRLNNMSPLHGALIAGAVANDGIIMEPSIVNHIFDREGKYEYTTQNRPLGKAMNAETARQLRLMMEKTITSGTSRRAFAGFRRHIVLSQLNMGGKTGTLDGQSPPGRYDWFVGYASKGDKKIAVAALCIHGERRGVKAAAVARKVFETYFKPNLAIR